ncbi:MAG TPA: hypothetical protein VEG27_01705 [Usitatibacter sp.]|nr:hypothetical protein [Usitatibacter sp.]
MATAILSGRAGALLRACATLLERAADRLERPVARTLALERVVPRGSGAGSAASYAERLAEMRERHHIPYY